MFDKIMDTIKSLISLFHENLLLIIHRLKYHYMKISIENLHALKFLRNEKLRDLQCNECTLYKTNI